MASGNGGYILTYDGNTNALPPDVQNLIKQGFTLRGAVLPFSESENEEENQRAQQVPYELSQYFTLQREQGTHTPSRIYN